MITNISHFLSSISFAATATTILVAGAAQALTVVPTDLNPGDEYRLVFVTDDTRDATSSNIADYNAFVTNDVIGSQLEIDLMAAGLTPEWFAIASTLTVDAIDNTSTNGTGVPIYLITGERVANDYVDLWDGSILTNIDTTPLDTTPELTAVWTGTNIDGTSSFGGLGLGLAPIFGGADSITNEWIIVGTADRTGELRVYSMSSVLEVPEQEVISTREPSSLLSFITLGGMLLGSAVRRARK